MKNLENIHPGEVLKEEFLIPLGISAYKLAKETFMPQTRISEIRVTLNLRGLSK